MGMAKRESLEGGEKMGRFLSLVRNPKVQLTATIYRLIFMAVCCGLILWVLFAKVI